MSVAIGLQGAQSSTSAGRGLARYVQDSVTALALRAPGRIAKLCLDPELPTPEFVLELPPVLPIGPFSESPGNCRGLIYHAPSPFELLPLESIWPRWARDPGVALVVTVHDLIPFMFPERYLHIDNVRRWHLPRLGMLEVADALIAISFSTAHDVASRLAVDPARIFVTHEDCSDLFKPATEAVETLMAKVQAGLPRLRSGFLLYVGGLDWRKNIEGLIAAYARLDLESRKRHQLVIAGKVHPDETGPLLELARRLGVEANVIFTGYITDQQLVLLYQCCELFVFPSFYEGFGLPALEAMRCRAPVLVSNSSSLRELVPDAEARFDPSSVDDIAAHIRRGIRDDAFRAHLREMGALESGRYSWDRSVSETLRAYEYAAERRSRLTE